LIAGHAGLLLFDGHLRPGVPGITLPFALAYRPAFTAIGIIAGWLAAHSPHVVGAGSYGQSWWMLAMLTALTAPIVFAFTHRILPVVPRHVRAELPVQFDGALRIAARLPPATLGP
jgi:hypothetical protein